MKKIFSTLAVMLLGGIIGHIVAQQSCCCLYGSALNKEECWMLNPAGVVFLYPLSIYTSEIGTVVAIFDDEKEMHGGDNAYRDREVISTVQGAVTGGRLLSVRMALEESFYSSIRGGFTEDKVDSFMRSKKS